MADKYWVGGTNTWNATAGSKWSLSSGGAGGASVPASSEDAYFNASSGGGVVSFSTNNSICRDANFVGFTGSFSGSQALNIHRSLYGGSSQMTGAWRFVSASTGNSIYFNAAPFAGTITFNGVGGEWILQDDASHIQANLTLTNGIFRQNGNWMRIVNLVLTGTNARTFDISNSTIEILGISLPWSGAITTNMTVISTGSTVKYTATAGTAPTFQLGGITLNNLWFAQVPTNVPTIVGNNTLNDLKIDPGRTLKLTSGSNQTVNSLTTSGTSGNLVTLQSSSSGSPATITKASGIVSVDYMSIKDITATGGATFYAGANSVDGGGNTGWIFTAPPSTVPTMAGISSMTGISSITF